MTNNCVAEKIQDREDWMYMEMQAYEQQPVIREKSVHIIKLSNEIRASLSDECAEKFDELVEIMEGLWADHSVAAFEMGVRWGTAS